MRLETSYKHFQVIILEVISVELEALNHKPLSTVCTDKNDVVLSFPSLIYIKYSGPSCPSKTIALCSHRDRLSASDMLQVRKVMEHVYEKIINLDNESQTTSSSANDKPGEQEKEEDMAMLAEEKIELMCQDQVGTTNYFSPNSQSPQWTMALNMSSPLYYTIWSFWFILHSNAE